jgi:methylenetetrahydrofolate--tRNA-(uracil-5-)-methyltransferase
MADRGFDTIRFGPMKPVGFIDPRTGNQPFALVQLRQDNLAGTIYNMVGFQTRLKFSEQKRVFRMIPGLDKAVFARYGVMHRNCYLNSPQILDKTLFIKQINQPVMAAGQITGVEGYVESIAIGLVAGLNMSRYILGRKILDYPSDTMLGSLIEYISGQTRLLNQGCRGNFSPMPANFGILPDIKVKRGPDKKSRKKQARAQRSFKSLSLFVEKL